MLTKTIIGLAAAGMMISMPMTSAVANDCTASAQQVVAQTGGELLSASAATQNGQSVCKITVLVKSSSGQRPKKMSVTVPQ